MACIACGGEDFEKTWLGTRCSRCGLTRHDVTTTSYEGDFFGSVEDDYYRSYVARAPQWRHEAAERVRWLRSRHEPHRLLEVGSAAGYFLEAAAAHGIDVVGVEPSADVAAYAREELRLDVRTGTFEAVELADRFDAICAWHVLEHVLDPLAFLEKARSLLGPGGIVALEVPNAESPASVRQGSSWPHWAPAHHIWHHTPTSLPLLLRRAGFAPDAAEVVSETAYARWNLDGVRVLRRRLLHGGGDFLRVIGRNSGAAGA